MTTFIGITALVLFTLNFFSQFILVAQDNIEGARWAALETALFLIAAAICFK